jgi:hypothetical protein
VKHDRKHGVVLALVSGPCCQALLADIAH